MFIRCIELSIRRQKRHQLQRKTIATEHFCEFKEIENESISCVRLLRQMLKIAEFIYGCLDCLSQIVAVILFGTSTDSRDTCSLCLCSENLYFYVYTRRQKATWVYPIVYECVLMAGRLANDCASH